MTRRMLALGGAGALAAAAQNLHFATRKARDRFVGAWILVSFERLPPGGQPFFPLGPDAIGRLTYDPYGRMSVQCMRRNRPPIDPAHATPDELRAALEGYVAYLGFYDVNEPGGFVNHHVEMSLNPNWIGTTQQRFYEFNDDKLILRARPQGGPEDTITWRRVLR